MNFRKKLALLGATALTVGFVAPGVAAAQTSPPSSNEPTTVARQAPAADEDDEDDDAIVVTGSRLRQSAFTSSSPIGVITAEESLLEGLANTADIVQQSPATGGAFQTNTQLTGFVTTGGPGVNTIGLRGLGANRTLVLLDGHRVGPAGTRGTVGPVDLNVIPSSLIQRVEILKDGASSIYGSDAVAGVVNFITRTDIDSLELNVYTNFNEDGGGEQHRINAAWGTTWTGGYFNIGAEFYEQEVLRNGDRDDLACAADYLFDPVTGDRVDYANTDPGQTNGDDTYKCYNLFSRVLRAGTALGSMDLIYPDPGVVYPNAAGGNNSPIAGLVRQGRVGFPGTFPYAHQDAPAYARTSALSPNELTTVVANFGFDLADIGEVYSQLMIHRRESVQYGARQFFPSVSTANLGNGYVGQVTSLLPIIPLASDRDQELNYYRGVLGLRGDIGDTGWTYDIYSQVSRSDADYGTDIVYNDRVLAVTGAGGCDQTDITISGGDCTVLAGQGGFIPWTDARILNGDFNAAEREFLFAHEWGNTTYDQQLVEVSVAGDTFEMPAGPVGVALGASWRSEEIDDTPGFNERNFNLWGSTSAGRTAGDDTVTEVFGEAEIPLLRDAFLAQSLDINISGRYTDYESYGEGDTYKVGLNWSLNDDWRIRASNGTSFRAPALYELYLANQTSFLGQASIDPCILWENSTNATLQANCAAAGIPLGYTNAGTSSATIFAGGGAGLLEAETSEANTVGIIWTPSDWGFSLAVDYFEITVEDEIRQFGAANILTSCYTSLTYPADPFCSLFVRNPGVNPVGGAGPYAIQSVQNNYVNVAEQGNRGIDVNLRYQRDLGEGRLTLSGEATFMLEDIVQIFQTGLVNDYLGTTQNYRGPEIVGTGSIRYDLNDWTFNWAIDYFGEGSDDAVFGGDVFNSTRYGQPVRYQQSVEPTIYHDFSVRRRLEAGGSDVALTLGLINIFDERPPSQSTGQFRRGTAALNAYDLVGRRVFMTASVAF